MVYGSSPSKKFWEINKEQQTDEPGFRDGCRHDSLRDKILLSSGEEDLEEITEMYLRAYCLGTVSLACEWIPGKYAVSSGELKEVYEASLPEPLHKYFF